MTKGRRAADRRRERQGRGGGSASGDDGGAPGTTDGEAVDPLPSEEDDDEPDEADLPLVSEIREVERSSSAARNAPRTQMDEGSVDTDAPRSGKGGKAGGGASSLSQDPEASFIAEVRGQSSSRKAGSGDITVVKPHSVDRPPRRGARVIVLEGADQGGEADIELNPCLIGRTATAEIGLTDPTVSLRHLEIRWGGRDEGFSLVDLGSTSGTLVNGKVVTGETQLAHGDVIALGKTELRFVRGDKVPQARPEPPPPEPEPQLQQEPTEQLPQREATRTRAQTSLPPLAPTQRVVQTRARIRKTATRIIAASAALLVVLALGKLVHDKFFTDKAPAQIRAQVAQLLADGRNRLRAQDVDGAKAAAQTVLALDEKNDEAGSLLRMAETEAEARDAIGLALRLGDEERDTEAEQILKRVPDASVFAPTRDRLRRTLDERGKVRSRRNIESLLDQGRAKDALAAAEAHVKSWPADEEGQALLEKAKAAQEVAPKFPGLSSARAAFASGNIDGARTIAKENNLTSYVRDLDTFQSSLAKGKAALSRFDDDAADSLDVAFRLLGALGGDASSPIFAEVRKPYAKALLVAGTAKLDANPCAAARQLYRAARVTPDDPAIEGKLRELDQRAVAALDNARAAKHQDADRASAIAREGLCLARVGGKTYDELRAMSRL